MCVLFARVCECVHRLKCLCAVSVEYPLVLYGLSFVCVFCVLFHVFVCFVRDLLCGVA